MTLQSVFIVSEQALQAVIDQIKDDQWDMPAGELTNGKQDLTLREIVNYHAYDSLWVPDVLAGKTIEEVGTAHDGDLLGDDPKVGYARASVAAINAVSHFNDLEKKVHLSYGDFTAEEYLKHVTCFRGFRVYTIARLIGVDTTMPAELVDGLWDAVIPDVANWRAMGVFGPEVPVPDDADEQTRLLGITGLYKPQD